MAITTFNHCSNRLLNRSIWQNGSKVLRTAYLALPLLLFAHAGLGKTDEPQSTGAEEALELRHGHFDRVKQRGERHFYTRKWDLSDLPSYKPEQQVAGIIRICGTDYLTAGFLAKYWEDGFRKFHPDIKFEYKRYDSVPGLYTGLADIGAGPRLRWADLQKFQDVFNYPVQEIQMVTGSYNVPGWSPAIGIFVHKNNPITKLTLKQLDGIFGAERRGGWEGTTWRPEVARGPEGNIRTWGQLGLSGEWKDKPINVYGRPLKYGIQLNMERKVFKGGSMWNEKLREYAHQLSPEGKAVLSSPTMLADLSKDPYGIAFSDMESATPQTKLVALAEKDGGPYVELTMENVQNRSYPLALEVYFHVNHKPGTGLDPKVREFLRYVLSQEGQDAVQRDGKWLPLTGEIVRAERKKLD